ncbi:MAG: class I SAM-dependent methyltransferase, partial [Candidatus Omnitrophica bacterium]|nr:class I SAM-dependent methyltransferase [Candidatus Omnitrophota bacterium]
MARTNFDKIACIYDEQLPEHIREYLLKKKTGLTVNALGRYGINSGSGIDLGCGTGWYLRALSQYGYNLVGVDNSNQLVREAQKNNEGGSVQIELMDILNLDYEPESFDFAYCINSLHHLKGKNDFFAALAQIHRILKKGGVLIVHELNTFFLFRLYLNYIFPLTSKIDAFGGENWISPAKIKKQGVFEVKEIYFYTFFPHIIPKPCFNLFIKVNEALEKNLFR